MDSCKSRDSAFEGHIQPKRPLGENYYNLLEKSTMEQQSFLMHKYGVDGLCFYHYYFKDGKKILERPAESLLQWQDIDMPFCFCWANESWARTWSNIGNKNPWAEKFEKNNCESDILLEQKYGHEFEWKKHFEYLLPFFCDERYICKGEKPIFLIYKPEEIFCLYQMTEFWRDLAKANGIPDLYFIGLNTIHLKKGLDAILWNAPGMFCNPALLGRDLSPNRINGIKTYSYDRVWDNILSAEPVETCKTFFGAFVNYDDSPRRGRNATVIKDFSIEKFKTYLYQLYRKNESIENEFVFINAWNEWGEGMYLEPDEVYGEQYLKVIKDVSDKIDREKMCQEWDLKRINKREDANREPKLQTLDKYRLIANCLDKWLALKERGINPASYLRQYNYSIVAVYGFGILGRHLLYDLEKEEIEIAYIIDRRVELKHPYIEIKGIDSSLENVDVVVVTAISEFDEIFDLLKTRISCPILSIQELIDEIE